MGVGSHILPPGGVCIMEDTHIESNIEKSPFGKDGKYEFKEQKSDYYEDNVRRSILAVSLPKRRLYSDFSSGNKTQAEKTIEDLENDNFVSVRNGTRLIAIDFGVYNPHADCVASIRLMFEFWPAGGIHASADTTLLKFQKDKTDI